jgi:hypothetical protein
MRALEKFVTKKKSFIQRIYLADWFDPIYRLYRKPFEIYHRIEKFIYYGRVGSKCWDFDANCIHDLIYAHIKRVHEYMNSSKTNSVWNDKQDTKPMRKLAEFKHLSKMMAENEMRYYENYNKVKLKYPDKTGMMAITSECPQYKRDIRRAFKLDQKVVDERLKRYYNLLEVDVPGFWD